MRDNTRDIQKLFVVLIAIFASMSLVGIVTDLLNTSHALLIFSFFTVSTVLSIIDNYKFSLIHASILAMLAFFVLLGTKTFESIHFVKALMLFTIAIYVVVCDVRSRVFHKTIILLAKLHFIFHLSQFTFLYFGSEFLIHSGQRIFYPFFLGFRAPGVFDEPSYAAGFYMLATASLFSIKDYDTQYRIRNNIVIFALGSLLTFSTGFFLHFILLFWFLFYRYWHYYIALTLFIIILTMVISGFSFSTDGGDAVRAGVIKSAFDAFSVSTLNIIFGLGIGGVETMFSDYNIYGSTTNSGLIDLLLALGLIGSLVSVLYFFLYLNIKNSFRFFHLCFFLLPSLFSINYLQLIFWVYLLGLRRSNNA